MAISAVIFEVDSTTSASELIFAVQISCSASPRNFRRHHSQFLSTFFADGEMRTSRITKPVHTTFVAHNTLRETSEKGRKISAVAVNLHQLGHFADLQHDAVVCICCHEVASQDGKLIDFEDPARPVLDFVERYLSRMLYHYRMLALFFANKFKTALSLAKIVLLGLSCHGFLMKCRQLRRCSRL